MEAEIRPTQAPTSRFAILDIWKDPGTRPLLVWAATLVLIGTLLFSWLENWSLLDGLYFSIISLTTVGYGDLTPTTPLTKILTIIYVGNGIGILLTFFNILAEERMARRTAKREAERSSQEGAPADESAGSNEANKDQGASR